MTRGYVLPYILASAALFTPASERSSSPRVTHQARSLQPGEVVGMTVESPVVLTRVVASAFGRTFPFYPDKTERIWHGLVGIDLNVRPGEHRVQVRAVQKGGRAIVVQHLLPIRGKTFPTRRLTVDEKYVNPPPEELDRIGRESEMVGEIFATATDLPLWRGPFNQPVQGEPSSSFGKRSILNGQPRSSHSGADFDAESGTPVHSPNSGRVVLAETLYFSGDTVIVDHGMGLYSYLAHLSKIVVEKGREVGRGELLGHVGATGRVTGPHLHWAIRLAGARVDPMSLLDVARIIQTP